MHGHPVVSSGLRNRASSCGVPRQRSPCEHRDLSESVGACRQHAAQQVRPAAETVACSAAEAASVDALAMSPLNSADWSTVAECFAPDPLRASVSSNATPEPQRMARQPLRKTASQPTPRSSSWRSTPFAPWRWTRVEEAKSGHPGTPMALAPVAYTLWNEVLRYDPGRSRLARPRPLRAVLRPCLDAALCHAAPGRREADGPTASRPASWPCRWTRSRSFRQLHSRCARPSRARATPPASKPPPARWARAAATAWAWPSPSAGWPRTSTGRASSCSTTTSTRCAATAT